MIRGNGLKLRIENFRIDNKTYFLMTRIIKGSG